jgi:RND family efflux transporter MFP subunit
MKNTQRKTWIIALVLLAILLGAGAGVWQTAQASKASATATPNAYQTSTVRKGDIAITVSGTGKAVASNSIDLAFSNSGNIATLNVQVGDTVKTGQVLAVLDTITTLEKAVTDAQLTLQVAEMNLAALKTTAATAKALAAQAAAQSALADAQNALRTAHDWRCPDSTTSAYYQAYLDAVMEARPWQALLAKANDVQKQFYLEKLNPILKKMDLALLNYNYCQAYTPAEITAGQANLQSATANFEKASAVYTTLKSNNGIDPTALAVDEAAVSNANIQLSKAQDDLKAATMTAPMDGTITYLSGAVGQPAGSAKLLTIVDATTLAVKATLDEVDLTNVAIDCPASVSFSMLTGIAFSGKVSEISSALVSSNGASMLETLISLNAEQTSSKRPALGATAAVEVTCQQAKNVLVIPVLALKETTGQTGTVYTLNSLGQPEKRAVEIGINTGVTVEILSGLTEGEKVIISEVKIP